MKLKTKRHLAVAAATLLTMNLSVAEAARQGAQGPIGLTGATGPVGATGAQGPIGLTGATGPAGSGSLNCATPLNIGDTGPAGGIVISVIDGIGCMGIEAETTDYGQASYLYTALTSFNPDPQLANINHTLCQTGDPAQMPKYCWHLPNRVEAQTLFAAIVQRPIMFNLDITAFYITSDAANYDPNAVPVVDQSHRGNIWVMRPDTGTLSLMPAASSAPYNVRVVRTFNTY